METLMKKYLIAAAILVGFVTPALADAFYVRLDMTNHKCITTKSHSMKHFKMMGSFPTLGEAQTAMHSMTECK